MNRLLEVQDRLLEAMPELPDRYLLSRVSWKQRLIVVKGARGVGKTTLLLRRIQTEFSGGGKALYASLDNLYFSENRLLDLADQFYKQGGTHLFLDEVHKYPNWTQHVKNIYDSYPKLHVVLTGSSILEIIKGNYDLSRRAVVYDMHGLSFREYLQIKTGEKFEAFTLDQIMKDHVAIARSVNSKLRPYAYFKDYLQHGYYPYFLEGTDSYYNKLAASINTSLETDLVLCRHVDPANVPKLKRLLYLVALSPPMIPNTQKLSSTIEVSRQTILQYLDHLADSKMLLQLRSGKKSHGYLSKPDKIYLHNTNLAYCIASSSTNEGNLRETFFFNQVSTAHKVETADNGDFLVDRKMTFEIGGMNKTGKQIKAVKNSFLAVDMMEIGSEGKIPLWIFGFLY